MRSLIFACFAILAAATVHADNLGIPLNDLGPLPYRLGYFGGLWENGSNDIPSDHLVDGLAFARDVVPRDVNGQPSPDGKIVMLAMGDGDTNRVICSPFITMGCEPGSFTEMVKDNPKVNPAFVVINGANEDFRDGVTRDSMPLLDHLKQYQLDPAGLSEQQVQVAWLQFSKDHPTVDITCACSDTYNIKIDIAMVLRALTARYPNLHIAYLSSRPYAGYSPNAWNTEPFAYDSAIAVRIVLFDQLEQVRTGLIGGDTRVGQINYNKGEAPWISWGPYLWANGTTPRSDGLTWLPEDYDGEFLSAKGAHKSAVQLFDFLTTDPTARLWFSTETVPGRSRTVRH